VDDYFGQFKHAVATSKRPGLKSQAEPVQAKIKVALPPTKQPAL